MSDEAASGRWRHGGGRFATTRWSVVLAARDRATPGWREALATLCETYWYPLYAFARRKGLGPEEARDLTQEFFTRLLEKGILRHARPEKGRFRSFLLTSFRNFQADKRRRAHAAKRGGGQVSIGLDLETAEELLSRAVRIDSAPSWQSGWSATWR